jgi:hypothetical protein
MKKAMVRPAVVPATPATVYFPFSEAYFKLATLQLDGQQWAAACYTLPRAAAALQSVPELTTVDAGQHE